MGEGSRVAAIGWHWDGRWVGTGVGCRVVAVGAGAEGGYGVGCKAVALGAAAEGR